MSSIEGFISESPISMSKVAESLQLMRRLHPKGHFWTYGTELGLLFEGKINILPSDMVCHSHLGLGDRTFTKILTRAKGREKVVDVFKRLDILNVETKTLLVAQTLADFPINGRYRDIDSNLVVDPELSVAVCGYITWVLENTNEGRVRKNIENFGSGRDAHVFAGWVRDVEVKNACVIPTVTRCAALDQNGTLYAFRRDERADGYVHPRPGLFMAKDDTNLFVASTTVRALEILLKDHPLLNKNMIRTVKNGEIVYFS